LHGTPTPRIGGLVLNPAWLLTCALLWSAGAVSFGSLPTAVGLVWLALFAVSALDDANPLSVWLRLPAHLLASGIGVWALFDAVAAPLAPWLWLIYTFAVAWSMNLFNFMDGSNGLAGGMTLIGFAALALAAHPADPVLTVICLAVAGAALGFLLFNFGTARVFLGDAGSVPIGALAALVGTAGIARGTWSPYLPIMVFLPFIADATLTLTRRLARREPIWQAHRQHGYQKLIQLGWSHRKVAASAYGLMAVLGLAALVLDKIGQITTLLGLTGAIGVLVILLSAIERRWTKKFQSSS
jgi:UDP-N-acetylmuramyl pentapeptide phosphotransferase/UDP-N-acetylglucosamine-1-phosphate transferase